MIYALMKVHNGAIVDLKLTHKPPLELPVNSLLGRAVDVGCDVMLLARRDSETMPALMIDGSSYAKWLREERGIGKSS